MFGFGSLRGVSPQVAAEVRQRLYRLVFPARDDLARGVPGAGESFRAGDSRAGARTRGPEPEPDDTANDADEELTSAPEDTTADGAGWSETPRLRKAHLVVVAILLVLALLAAIIVVVRRPPTPEPVPEASPAFGTSTAAVGEGGASPGATVGASPSGAAAAGPGAAGNGPSASAASRIVVHVAGKVRQPGVVTLPAGSRVVDAIEASGGAKPGADLGTVNLARPLQDGEQVLVDTEAAAGVPAGGGAVLSPGAVPTAGPIDLNSATLAELEELPGIGPALGQRILDFRTERGGFSSVEELHEVSGIGEQRYSELQDRVVVR